MQGQGLNANHIDFLLGVTKRKPYIFQTFDEVVSNFTLLVYISRILSN